MPERDPDFQAVRKQASRQIPAVSRSLMAMIDWLDPKVGHHDDAAELLLAVAALGDTYRELKAAMEEKVLAWLLQNEEGVRSIRAGDWKWFGEKEKSVKCNDVGEAGAAVADATLSESLLRAIAGVGDEGAVEIFIGSLRDFFRSYVSTQGLKEGACHKALGDERYRELWSETWPDKLKGGEPALKLGVANMRFVHRSEGGSKAELEELERRKLAEGL